VPVRILVVEEDSVLREVFADHDLGYQVEAVAEGGEALRRLRNEPFDVLVTDIVLRGMDGWQLVAAALQEQPMLRLVAMTGADAHSDRERAVALGVPMLQKPFTLVELRDALQEGLTSFRGPGHPNCLLHQGVPVVWRDESRELHRGDAERAAARLSVVSPAASVRLS
jgi:CheY-like chemotaxis protein